MVDDTEVDDDLASFKLSFSDNEALALHMVYIAAQVNYLQINQN
jgi:hypothetical protein